MRNSPSHPITSRSRPCQLTGIARIRQGRVAIDRCGANLSWGTAGMGYQSVPSCHLQSHKLQKLFVRYFHMCFIHLFWSKNTRYNTLTVQEVIYVICHICIWMHLRHVTEVQHQKGTSWQGRMKGISGKAQLSSPGWWWAAGAHFVLVHAEQVSCANWLFKRKDKPKNYTSENGSKGWMPTNFAM